MVNKVQQRNFREYFSEELEKEVIGICVKLAKINYDDFTEKTRKREIVFARYLYSYYMYFIIKKSKFSKIINTPELKLHLTLFGGELKLYSNLITYNGIAMTLDKDHATAMHGVKTIIDLDSTDKNIKAIVTKGIIEISAAADKLFKRSYIALYPKGHPNPNLPRILEVHHSPNNLVHLTLTQEMYNKFNSTLNDFLDLFPEFQNSYTIEKQ